MTPERLTPPAPRRIFRFRDVGTDGEPSTEVALTPELLGQARRYALEWEAMFGRFPQGQHPLKFPVNTQIKLHEADLIIEYPVDAVFTHRVR
jgi:hypothetical protein